MAGFLGLDELFRGRHFDREVIVLCVRWYLRFKLSYRDLVEMMAERGLSLAHTTIMRWVHHYTPEFERRWNRFCPPGRIFVACVDETYVKIRGKWSRNFAGRSTARAEPWTSACSRKRDVGRGRRRSSARPSRVRGSTRRTITLDGYAAPHRAVREDEDRRPAASGYEGALIEVSE